MRRSLSNHEVKVLNEPLKAFNFALEKKSRVEILETPDLKLIIANGQPLFFYHEEKIVPTLFFLMKTMPLKKVIVDMGAVKFVTSGADVMRPGITYIEHEFNAGDFVAVVDERHSKPLAVCIALFSSREIEASKSGKSLKNIHFVGDLIWKGAESLVKALPDKSKE